MKYTIFDKLTALREKLSVHKAGTRLLALLLALVLLQGDLMLPAYSAEEDSGDTSTQSTTNDNTPTPLADGDDTSSDTDDMQPVDEDTTICTVTIDYVYADSSKFAGQRVAIPYIAEIAKGETFENKQENIATSPICVGYSPSVSSINLSELGKIEEDRHIQVTYSPAQVSYTVRHYLQNVNDDEYVWADTTMATGYTEALTSDAVAKNIDGFTALSHYHEEIAADSSTMIDIYYDRNYYLMSFDLDGGHGVDPIYARYGTPISVDAPSKAGWTFNGWDKMIPSTMPNADQTYKASWTADPAGVNYTVAYWLEDANDAGEYNFWGSTTLTAEAGTTVQGEDYRYYTNYLDPDTVNAMDTYEKRYSYYDHADTDVTIKGDGSTVVNVYYNRNEYTLKFYYAARTGNAGSYTYKIFGGSTYDFGQDQTDTNIYGDELRLLNNMYYNKSGQWGQITNEPTLNSEGTSRVTNKIYTQGIDSYNNVDYLYISFNAKYGADISGAWPCNVFDAATRTSIANNKNGWTGTAAYVSAWNGEHHVYYSQHNANETIKGNYNELDYQLLFDNCGSHKYTDSSTVAYLCFWENGSAGVDWNIPRLFRYNIWIPVLAGQDVTGLTTKTDSGTTYYLLTIYDTCDDSNVGSQTAPAINGYDLEKGPVDGGVITNYDTTKYASATNVDFFYSRDLYKLTFVNGDTTVQETTVGFDADISRMAPDVLYYDEDLAYMYVFGGWYTSSDCVDGSEFDLTGATMPASALTLYAKWDLITHNVDIYLTKDNADNKTNPIYQDIAVTHNTAVPDDSHPNESELTHPTDAKATLIGWFYLDENGNEQAFDFATGLVIQNMSIYAKWRSNQMKKVEIRYVVTDGGAGIQIADTETLMLRLGQTRTFEAKVGTSLYVDYRTGYFPTTATHSITPTEAHFENDDPIVYEFVYKHYGKVPYQIKYYVEKDGQKWPAFQTDTSGNAVFVDYGQWNNSYTEYIERHWQNDKAIVTELYIPEHLATPTWTLPDAYLPNALKIQKIIVPSGDDPENNIEANTIEFIYTYTEPVDPDNPDNPDPDPDPDNPVYQSRYLVQHYLQSSSDLNDYTTLYRYSDEIGLSGNTATASPISIPGYTYSYDVTDTKKQAGTTLTKDPNTMSGTITADDKLELNFYYTVNPYPYQVMYLEDVTNRVLAPTKTTDTDGNLLTGLYSSSVTETAIPLEGYDIVGADTKSIYIQMEAGNTASVNTIVFYYKQKSAELLLTKTVELDPTQAAQEGISEIPSWVYNQEFVFTIYNAKGFPKSVYGYTHTDANDVASQRTVIAGLQTIVVSLKPGESIQLHDFPMGEYTVTETYVPGFKASINNYIAQTHPVKIETDGQVGKLNFLNTFPFYTGDLVILKNVIKHDTENDPTAIEPYRVTVVLTPDDAAREVDRVITFVDKDGNTATDANGKFSFTIPKLTGTNDQTTFTIDVLVPVDGEIKLKDVPVGAFTATEVPKGDVGYIYDFYTVKYNKAVHENDEVRGTNHVVSGSIHGGHPTAVTFNNTYKKGSLTINKTVSQEYENDNWSSDTFTFTITGTTELPDGSYSVNGATVSVSGGKVTVKDADGNDPTISITRTDGATRWSDSLFFENLPAGYYTVTESAGLGNDRYRAILTQEPDTGLVNDTSVPATFSFENTYLRTTGSLQVGKEIKIVTAGSVIDTKQAFTFVVEPKDGTLTGDYTCTLKTTNGTSDTSDDTDIIGSPTSLSVSDGKLTFTLKHNQYILISGLPVGNYTVSEEAVEGYDSSFGDVQTNAGNYSVDPATITTNNTTVLNCQNAYPVYYSNLIVKKNVVTPTDHSAIDQAPKDDEFTFTVTISDYSNKISLTGGIGAKFYENAEDTTPDEKSLTVTDNTLTFSLKNGEWVNLNLPACKYTIAETGMTSTKNTGVLSDHYTTTCNIGETGSVLVSGETETVVFTNTYKRHYTDLTIAQTGMESTDSGIYKVTDPNGVTIATVVITGNSSAIIKDLSVGSQYTVTELTDWNWEYTVDGSASQSIVLPETTANSVVTFKNKYADPDWLGGECYKDNNFN